MRTKGLIISLLTVVIGLLSSCKPALPSGILSKGDMEDILYDYHIAMAMAAQTSDVAVNQRAYEAAVMKKNDVTQEEFDASLAYYMRHTEMLEEVYEHVSDRLKETAQEMGASASDLQRYGSLSATGDTANIWMGAPAFVLVPQAPFNQRSFTIEGDTAFHAGDNIMLNFDVTFLYQDGMRQGCALLAITFKNDSVAYSYNQISASSHFSMSLQDYHHHGIKNVKGYFLLTKGQNPSESKTTLQLMFVDNVRLVRMHENQKAAEEQRRQDSIQAASAAASAGATPAPVSSGQPIPATPADSLKLRNVPVKDNKIK